MNLYFTYESRYTRKSFILFITVKTISKLNAKHSDEYEIKILVVVVHVLQTTQNLVISRCWFAEDNKELYQDSKRTCTAIVLLIKPFVWWRSHCRRRRGFVNSLIPVWARREERLSRSQLYQPFRIDSDAVLHINLIHWIRFGSCEVRRLNRALNSLFSRTDRLRSVNKGVYFMARAKTRTS